MGGEGSRKEGTSVSHSLDDKTEQPEILTLHWEGPESHSPPAEVRFPQSPDEAREAREAQRERDLQEIGRTRQGREIWERIRSEGGQRGDEELWQKKLHAYWWVKMRAEGTAGDFARRYDLNHATVRTWIADVAKVAYEVGYRLHEDRLLLVGEAPAELTRLRELVNENAGSVAAAAELRARAPRFRGEDPYFHLNEGHILRAQGRLRDSDETLRDGLTIAEARPVRALLWNARGQTLWDCTSTSSYPLRDHLVRTERAFRRAAVLDPTIYFPLVNLAQLAMDAGDARRCEYWLGELSGARKRMSDEMKDDLAHYLREAEWTGPIEGSRLWRSGPVKWMKEATRRGVLITLVVLGLVGAVFGTPASADSNPAGVADTVDHGGRRGNNSGAGGN
jgi:hypothetical protein